MADLVVEARKPIVFLHFHSSIKVLLHCAYIYCKNILLRKWHYEFYHRTCKWLRPWLTNAQSWRPTMQFWRHAVKTKLLLVTALIPQAINAIIAHEFKLLWVKTKTKQVCRSRWGLGHQDHNCGKIVDGDHEFDHEGAWLFWLFANAVFTRLDCTFLQLFALGTLLESFELTELRPNMIQLLTGWCH